MNALWLWALIAAYCLGAETAARLRARRRDGRRDRIRAHARCDHRWRGRAAGLRGVVCVRCGEIAARPILLPRGDPFGPGRLRTWHADQLRAAHAREAAALAAELARRGG